MTSDSFSSSLRAYRERGFFKEIKIPKRIECKTNIDNCPLAIVFLAGTPEIKTKKSKRSTR